MAIPAIGTRVRIHDFSEAHGDVGTIHSTQIDQVVVELVDGELWVCWPSELEVVDEAPPPCPACANRYGRSASCRHG